MKQINLSTESNTLSIYTYSELVELGDDKAIQRAFESTYESRALDLVSDMLPESLCDELNYSYGFKLNDFKGLSYSLSYSQGDGVCFNPIKCDIDELYKHLTKLEQFKEYEHKSILVPLLLMVQSGLFSDIIRPNNNYSHEYSYSFENYNYSLDSFLDVLNNNQDSLFEGPILLELAMNLYYNWERFFEDFESYYRDTCRELKNKGYEFMEWYEKPEGYALEHSKGLEDTDLYFFADGSEVPAQIINLIN